MKFIEKLIKFFKKTELTVEEIKAKVEAYVELHKGTIKVVMNMLQVLYVKTDGKNKMKCIVTMVFNALHLSKYTNGHEEEIINFIEAKCQKVYDELVNDGVLDTPKGV